MKTKKDIWYLIENLTCSDEFWYVNYYLRTMKKAPHGGVFHVNIPNAFIMHYPFSATSFITCIEEIPFFMQELIRKGTELYSECTDLDIEDLMTYCFSGNDNWYPGYRLLEIRPEHKREYADIGPALLWKIIEDKTRFSDYFTISVQNAVLGLVLTLVSENEIVIPNAAIIVEHECLRIPHDKYGLSLVNTAEFMRQGFHIDKVYYLYNIFLDTTISNPNAEMPLTLEIIKNNISNGHFYMRCDNRLSVPYSKLLSTATVDFQKFHGITLDFADIDSIIKKQTIVHIHSELLHKIVVIVKPDKENGEGFFHVEIEELWNPSSVKDEYIMAVFLHAKYFPSKRGFTHIDYTINQYDFDTYVAKYLESVNSTMVPIDKYCDVHYKVWCVEADWIAVQTWSHLVYATLDEPFRELFLETYRTECD